MRLIHLIVLIFLSTYAKAQHVEEWEPIFNGKDLEGWTVIGGGGKVLVENNSMVLNRKAYTKEHTFICTDKSYKDFILEVDAMGEESSNFYGILFRAQFAPDTAHVRLYGYQVKADHNAKRNWTGGIFDDFGNTWNWMYSPVNDLRAQKARRPAGEWDHYRIEAIGDTIKVWLNDIPISNISNGKYDEGKIAIKIHFLKDNPEKEKNTAWVKNIKMVTVNVRKYSRSMDIPLVLVE